MASNRSFIYRHFKGWLKDNRKRFRCNPYITYIKKRSFRVMFQECEGQICLDVNQYGEFSIWSQFRDKKTIKYAREHELVHCDWIADFDFYLCQTARGHFYCQWATGPSSEYQYQCLYNTKEELLIQQCYEPFLAWANENIVAGSKILFYESSARIISSDTQIKRTGEKLLYVYTIKEIKNSL